MELEKWFPKAFNRQCSFHTVQAIQVVIPMDGKDQKESDICLIQPVKIAIQQFEFNVMLKYVWIGFREVCYVETIESSKK